MIALRRFEPLDRTHRDHSAIHTLNGSTNTLRWVVRLRSASEGVRQPAQRHCFGNKILRRVAPWAPLLPFARLMLRRCCLPMMRGGYFRSDNEFLDRYASDSLTESDHVFLSDNGHCYSTKDDLACTSYAFRWARRQSIQKNPSYIILVPTLRCNLTWFLAPRRQPEASIGTTKHSPARSLCWMDWRLPTSKLNFREANPASPRLG